MTFNYKEQFGRTSRRISPRETFQCARSQLADHLHRKFDRGEFRRAELAGRLYSGTANRHRHVLFRLRDKMDVSFTPSSGKA